VGAQGTGVQNGDAQAPWQTARDLLNELRRENRVENLAREADGFNPGRSAPGTEAWKQDFAKWDELKTQIAAALERAEQTAADSLRGQQARDRLNAGVTQAVPEAYRRPGEALPRWSIIGGAVIMQFAIALPWWALLLVAAAVGVVAWGCYAGAIVPLVPRHRAILSALRALVLLLLVACLLRPVRVVPPDASTDAVVPVLVDVSRSMTVADMDGRTRFDAARDLLEREVRPALARRFVPELWAFGNTLEQMTGAVMSADAGRSDLSGALRPARPLPRTPGCRSDHPWQTRAQDARRPSTPRRAAADGARAAHHLRFRGRCPPGDGTGGFFSRPHGCRGQPGP
jgi:hypothetical protein